MKMKMNLTFFVLSSEVIHENPTCSFIPILNDLTKSNFILLSYTNTILAQRVWY